MLAISLPMGSRAELDAILRELTRLSEAPSWVNELYSASLGKFSDKKIIEMMSALEHEIYTDLGGLDRILAEIEIERLDPVFIVGIARSLFTLRERLSNWKPFVLRARDEFLARPELDGPGLLQGLL